MDYREVLEILQPFDEVYIKMVDYVIPLFAFYFIYVKCMNKIMYAFCKKTVRYLAKKDGFDINSPMIKTFINRN